jgi:stearoyl-CoA desaturase (delta-9 desaturase)
MPIAAYGGALSRTNTDEGSLSELNEKEFVPYSKQQRMPAAGFKDIRWMMGGYITLVHVLAITGLFYIPSCKAATLWWAFILWPISGFGITGGAHRLWAHRSYTATLPYRFVLMLANSVANQGTIWHWARDHRTHHFHSETVADPHDAIRGFWFAHIGWLYIKRDKRVSQAGAKVNMDDLRADGPVMLQRKLDPWWNLFFCFAMPGLVASALWGETGINGFFVPGCLRYAWVLHCTWFVNSAAHLWGERPYDPDSNPAENPWVAILSVGEGWHNWHHKYPFDYAASEYGILRQFNPSKLVIDVCAAVGLVTERKRATAMWAREKAKLAAKAKEAKAE